MVLCWACQIEILFVAHEDGGEDVGLVGLTVAVGPAFVAGV